MPKFWTFIWRYGRIQRDRWDSMYEADKFMQYCMDDAQGWPGRIVLQNQKGLKTIKRYTRKSPVQLGGLSEW